MKHLIFFAIAILVVSQAAEAKKLKQTHVEFYMHDTVGGPNPSAVRVAGRSNFTGSNPIAAMFGSIYMVDNPLTVTHALNSNVMSRAQGIYGISFGVIGRNPIANDVREMPVVGGTGMFRFPLDKEPDTFCISTAQVPRGTMVFNSNGDNKKTFHETNKMASCNNKCDGDKETVPSSTQSNNIELEEKEIDESSWPHFADEDYIIFCFKEDGGIHVVQDGKPEVSDHVDRMTRSSTRPINHKGKGKWNMNLEMDTTLHRGVWRVDEKNDIIEEEEEEEEEEEITKESKMVLSTTTTQSSESSTDQSDGSSSSFAFPILCSEGMGSPVRMPKPNSLHFRKRHKALATRLHCCHF
ncbi:unnamed protein product [Camellia sinensis]